MESEHLSSKSGTYLLLFPLKGCKSKFSVQANGRQYSSGFWRVQLCVIYHTLAAFSTAIMPAHIELPTVLLLKQRVRIRAEISNRVSNFDLSIEIFCLGYCFNREKGG